MDVYCVHERTQKKTRSIADDVATYGSEFLRYLGHTDYATVVGLSLNRERVDKRRALVVLEAIYTSLSPVPNQELFRAAALTDEQGDANYHLQQAHAMRDQWLSGRPL